MIGCNQKILSLFKDEETKNKKVRANEVMLEIEPGKIPLFLNQIFEQDVKLKSLFIGQKGSQQIYEDIYEGRENNGTNEVRVIEIH